MLIGRMFGLRGLGQTSPAPGDCSADGAFIWTVQDGAGFWARKGPSQVCNAPVGPPPTGPTVHVHTAGGRAGIDTLAPAQQIVQHGPIVVRYKFSDDDASSSAPNAATQSLQVGPFVIPMAARQYTIHWEGQMPADWTAFITQELARDCSNCVFSSMIDATPGHVGGRLRDFFGDSLPAKINQDLVSFPAPSVDLAAYMQSLQSGATSRPQQIHMDVNLPDQPIAVVKRPDTGEEWGMFMVVLPKDPTNFWDSSTNPYVLNFFWRKKPQGVWDWIKRIVGAVVDFVEKLACSAMPFAMTAPNPYVKAGAVVLKLSGECNQQCPQGMTYNDQAKICTCPPGQAYDAASKACVPFTPLPTSKFPTWLPWALGIGGLVLILAAGSKKPKV